MPQVRTLSKRKLAAILRSPLLSFEQCQYAGAVLAQRLKAILQRTRASKFVKVREING
jgi:hypothetical protein